MLLAKMRKLKFWPENYNLCAYDLLKYGIEVELLDNCGRSAASLLRQRNHETAFNKRVTDSPQTIHNKYLSVKFEVLRITVFGMCHHISLYKFTCGLDKPAASNLRIFF
jgi:hypothetical protein